jgi:hypothetical protein
MIDITLDTRLPQGKTFPLSVRVWMLTQVRGLLEPDLWPSQWYNHQLLVGGLIGWQWGAYGRLGGWNLWPQRLEGECCALLDIKVIPISEDSGSIGIQHSFMSAGWLQIHGALGLCGALGHLSFFYYPFILLPCFVH